MKREPSLTRVRSVMIKALYDLVKDDRFLELTEYEIFKEIMRLTGGRCNPMTAMEEARLLFRGD